MFTNPKLSSDFALAEGLPLGFSLLLLLFPQGVALSAAPAEVFSLGRDAEVSTPELTMSFPLARGARCEPV